MANLPPMKLQNAPGAGDIRIERTGIRGVDLYHLPWLTDPRGELTAGEFGGRIPFQPKRYFIVFGVVAGVVRGEHAHKACHQFLICAQGSCIARVDDGINRRDVILDHPSVGLYMPPMIWGTQHSYSGDGKLLVFASDHYDPADYIRDYGAFQSALAGSL